MEGKGDTGGDTGMINWGLHLFLLMLGKEAWHSGNNFGLRIKGSESLICTCIQDVCMYERI